jgi:hypothetical protein
MNMPVGASRAEAFTRQEVRICRRPIQNRRLPRQRPAQAIIARTHGGTWCPQTAGVYIVHLFDVTPDARWYAYSYVRDRSDLYLVEGLR